MDDTIRDYIKRRVRWGAGVAVVSWLFIAFTASTGALGPKPGLIPFIGFLGFAGALLSFMFIRCPKCRARLGQTIALPAAFRQFGPKVKYCPFCAVDLDEQMPTEVRNDLVR
jgi:hypothetical protein